MWFKPRSKFGRWLDENRISQWDMSEMSGVSRNTISQLANDKDVRPSWKVERKIMRIVRDYDFEISAEDFWPDDQ